MPRSSRSRAAPVDFWPGFVDALSTLLLVTIFLISMFVLAQHFLGSQLTTKDQAIVERDETIRDLRAQIAALSDQLSLAKRQTDDTRSNVEQLMATLAAMTAKAEALEADKGRLAGLLATSEATIETEKRSAFEARNEIGLLNEQIAALRQQILSLQEALAASEAKDRDNQVVIEQLGQRLNAALAQKVQELSDYRSDFFAKLKKAMGDRADIEVVGDRFVIQSEVFFASGSATLNAAAKPELGKIADVVRELDRIIPQDVDWVIRVDGHTDVVPIATPQFPSNWYLSSARAISVVNYLTSQGVPARRLVAAGFGEYRPLDTNPGEAGFRRNRRIEFKLTEG